MKYIILFTIQNEWTSHRVIDWCLYMGIKPIIIDSGKLTQHLASLKLSSLGSEFTLVYDGTTISSNSIIGYWYRRSSPICTDEWDFIHQNEQLKDFGYYELRFLQSGFFRLLETKRGINNLNNALTDKIHALLLAKECSINIPDTHIVTSKSELLEVIQNSEQRYIIKPIYNMMKMTFGDSSFLQYTSEVTLDDIPKNDFSFPLLIQERIEKFVEVRCFYLDQKTYSMAIFSQENEQTTEDFRRYVTHRPNRTVPYKLPHKLHAKIILLMKKMNLNCGSLDFILTPEGIFYFLEINPVGQFGMVSNPCNYYLEKKIIEHFTEHETNQ